MQIGMPPEEPFADDYDPDPFGHLEAPNFAATAPLPSEPQYDEAADDLFTDTVAPEAPAVFASSSSARLDEWRNELLQAARESLGDSQEQ